MGAGAHTCTKLHYDRYRATAIVVPVQEDVFEAHDIGMVQALQAGRLSERRIRFVDAVAPNHLEDIGTALPHDEVSMTITTRGELTPKLI